MSSEYEELKKVPLCKIKFRGPDGEIIDGEDPVAVLRKVRALLNVHRVVKQETLPNGIQVSTVWLCPMVLPSALSAVFNPPLYETMAWDNMDQVARCSYENRTEAEKGHEEVVKHLLERFPDETSGRNCQKGAAYRNRHNN